VLERLLAAHRGLDGGASWLSDGAFVPLACVLAEERQLQ
jgi:hypothetical protein